MSEYQIILLPKADYLKWVEAVREYVLAFGPNFTNDPKSAVRYAFAPLIVTVADVPGGYPEQGDIRLWFQRYYPQVKLDLVPARTPQDLRLALQRRVQANDRYLPVPPVFDFGRLWPAGRCLAGVHGRADGRLEAADFEVVAQARLEAVKLLTSAAPEDVDRLRAINPQIFIMVRLFADFRNRVVSAEDFVSWMVGDMRGFYERGVRYYEIHNEPNLRPEGWTVSWQDGREFGAWWLAVRRGLKALFPQALFGWPGLSPDGFPMPERTNDMRFLEAAADAVQAADFLGIHCYWRDEAEMNALSGGQGWREYRRRFPEKLLFITEFSNPTPHTSLAAKGEQYARYYQMLRNEPGLGAAFAFVSSASADFPHEAWRDERGMLTPIVAAVGRRAMA